MVACVSMNWLIEMSIVPALPQLPDVVFRPFRGSSDYVHFIRIINAVARERERIAWRRSRAWPPTTTTSSAATPSATCSSPRSTVGPSRYSRVSWDQEVDGPRTYTQVCFVRSRFRRAVASAPRSSPGTRAACARSPQSTTPRTSSSRSSSTTANTAATALVRGIRVRARHVRGRDGASVRRGPPRSPAPGGRRDQTRDRGSATHDLGGRHGGLSRSLGLRRADRGVIRALPGASRTATSRSGRSRGTTRASRVRSGRSSTPRRTRSTASGGAGRRTSRQRAAGGAVASRRR